MKAMHLFARKMCQHVDPKFCRPEFKVFLALQEERRAEESTVQNTDVKGTK